MKRDVLLIPALFFVNSYFFSTGFHELRGVAAKPWLILVMLYGLAGVLPLAWRDKAPGTVFAILWAHTVFGWPILPWYPSVLGIAVALYAVSLHCEIKNSLLMLLAAVVPGAFLVTLPLRIEPDMPELGNQIIVNVIVVLVLFLGAWSQGRLIRAGQQHLKILEREREAAREAEVLASERRRIARELHDIVSHAVTVIVLQAAGASRVAKTDFAQVTQSLAHIEATGKQAMIELRRLLGVLGSSDPADHPVGPGKLGPQPGLADVTALLTSLRATGMLVTIDVEGTPRDLDSSVDLVAYRIVQEGLTNVLKHAGKNADPRLRLSWEAQNLVIRIDNDTKHMAAHREQVLSAGRGLVGLRERAYAVGGCLYAGPCDEDGYQLTATLPLMDTAQRMPQPPPVVRPVDQRGTRPDSTGAG